MVGTQTVAIRGVDVSTTQSLVQRNGILYSFRLRQASGRLHLLEWHFFYFAPLPQGHGSFHPGFWAFPWEFTFSDGLKFNGRYVDTTNQRG
jgi:hypothetical protein